jgi:hypothetical protein
VKIVDARCSAGWRKVTAGPRKMTLLARKATLSARKATRFGARRPFCSRTV